MPDNSKIHGEKFLRDMGLLSEEHNPEEQVDYGTLGLIIKNLMENYTIKK